MPELDDGAQKLLDLALEIERMEHHLIETEYRLHDLKEQFVRLARAYGTTDASAVLEGSRSGPWIDAKRSISERVRLYFQARPQARVTASDLVEAGIAVEIPSLRSALHRLCRDGHLARLEKGVFALAESEKGKPTA